MSKSLVFSNEDIEDLMRTRYRHRNSLVLLTLLYPEVTSSTGLHKDHVFPKSMFIRTKLTKFG